MKRRLRELAKTAAVKGGGLSLYHRLKHREHLTVLMFHRVLPEELKADADAEYTVSTSLLDAVTAFVAQHYNVVTLNDVLKSRKGEKPLPSYPLLITFDDGWNDNAVYAAPLLAAANTPWTLFAATDAISSGERWWQEVLLSALRTGLASHQELRAALPNHGDETFGGDLDPDLSLLILYGKLPATKRDDLINHHLNVSSRPSNPRHMATWDTLRTLQNAGIGIGGHGASHLPLTMLADAANDLQQAHTVLRRELGDDACRTLSFPHGRYNQEIAKIGRAMGMQLMFTSDPILNDCPGGWLKSDLIGRIPVSTAAIADECGRLDLERVMPWMMLRP